MFVEVNAANKTLNIQQELTYFSIEWYAVFANFEWLE
jgi:hypothetical protein